MLTPSGRFAPALSLLALTFAMAFALVACTSREVKPDSRQHLAAVPASAPAAAIPPVLTRSLQLDPPRHAPKPETYSVVVNGVKVQELLFSLARDAKVNVDIHPGVTGTVTLNALNQTLPQLLARIARQVDMRFELDGPNLVVMPDTPYLHHYRVDYVNLARDATSAVSISAQVTTAVGNNSSISAGTSNTNASQSRIENTSKNRFWDTLVQNIKDLLRETDKIMPDGKPTAPPAAPAPAAPPAFALGGAPATTPPAVAAPEHSAGVTFREAASVIANIETGVLSVRATSRQHEKVREFLDRVIHRAKRQVLIEATIAEVQLSQNYQQGIDWSALNIFDSGFRIIQKAAGDLSAPGASLLELGYNSSGNKFTSTIKLLDSFGNVRVLSSPKIAVLNNQSAVLKVVDDNVYFTIAIEEREGTANAQARTTYTTTVHSVPVGLVMNITPQVGDDDSITLNVRPTLSRVIGQAVDPNPVLKDKGITNTIPVIRAREMDSVMRVSDGNIAVLGGLMEDSVDLRTDAAPGLANLPIIGGLFQNRDDTKRKTELVIFIRPTIIREGSSTAAPLDPDILDQRIGPPLYTPWPSSGGGKP